MEKESQIIIFETQDKSISLPVMIADESAWINRNQMAELFGRDVKTIGKHINNALREELSDENAVVAKFATTAADGKTYMTEEEDNSVVVMNGEVLGNTQYMANVIAEHTDSDISLLYHEI